eukprot:15438339-Alexandrium_andersonii.AAC.1
MKAALAHQNAVGVIGAGGGGGARAGWAELAPRRPQRGATASHARARAKLRSRASCAGAP